MVKICISFVFVFITAKGSSYIVKKAGTEIGSKFAEKSKGLFSADDWQCSKYV